MLIEEAIRNHRSGFNHLGEKKEYFVLVEYNGRIYYEVSKHDPNQNPKVKEFMLNQIKKEILNKEP